MEVAQQPDNIIDRITHQLKLISMSGCIPSRIMLSELDFLDFVKLPLGTHSGRHDKFIEELRKLTFKEDMRNCIGNYIRKVFRRSTMDVVWVNASREWWVVMYKKPNDDTTLRCTKPFTTKESALTEADRLVSNGEAAKDSLKLDYSENHIIDPH